MYVRQLNECEREQATESTTELKLTKDVPILIAIRSRHVSRADVIETNQTDQNPTAKTAKTGHRELSTIQKKQHSYCSAPVETFKSRLFNSFFLQT